VATPRQPSSSASTATAATAAAAARHRVQVAQAEGACPLGVGDRVQRRYVLEPQPVADADQRIALQLQPLQRRHADGDASRQRPQLVVRRIEHLQLAEVAHRRWQTAQDVLVHQQQLQVLRGDDSQTAQQDSR
jgi:hypothetical protein